MYLGIELGSTRIKGVVLNENYQIIATGSYRWQSSFIDGLWTYDINEVWQGINEVLSQIQTIIDLKTIRSMGISAMMHGFIALDEKRQLLTPFRTWKNTNTAVAASELSQLFSFNIPLRWSIAHLYQAYLEKESYIGKIAQITTLAGYVHACLTGEHVLGIGDASGMFPIDTDTRDYDTKMVNAFLDKTGIDVRQLLPKIVPLGETAGFLTPEGQNYLQNRLMAGLRFAPPEGDAQTGMVATNSLKPKTGNVSAGTSVFSMVVLEKPLVKWYPEIDIVQTPLGDGVAMVHANECTSRIDPWIELFGEAALRLTGTINRDELFKTLYESALDKNSTLGAFMRERLIEAIIDLKPGMDILIKKEHINIDFLYGHGGYFKSKSAGATIMSAVLGIPIRLLKTASEGGPWGMAVLAAYCDIYEKKHCPFDEIIHQVFERE